LVKGMWKKVEEDKKVFVTKGGGGGEPLGGEKSMGSSKTVAGKGDNKRPFRHRRPPP